ncbi:hypothetical protein P8C59_003783 [Phyllachora maydis]|uniref:ENTH domain-containing protein n=1 Tax=Phyllachora maydis TaxID=1825666 RepID=A0AAD9M9N3_9PEZI|nr:hypothetical protein P8C59_003783 [Phyllachora maydis]
MDFNSLKDTVSNLTLYDVKAGIRKVQNAVMNYTDMEAKVREATNNEPWGASSTLMQEIANGTFNYQTLNEIMPMIYRRFTEKAAEEWRQIYKALQLLEFLIKHGSERVIDDARSHLTLLKMLRQFHFIDANGKDQGINVRNRAKELADLLSDVERIRNERKKARSNRQKYVGVEGGGAGGFSSSSRYGGFGSESGGYAGGEYGGFSGGVYGDGGGFGGQQGDFRDSQGRGDKFEEYDEFDEGERPAPAESSSTPRAKRTTERAGVKKTTAEAAKKKEAEVDLFSFDEPGPSSLAAAPPMGAADDDDFDDFQSATPSTHTTTAGPTSFAGSLPPPMSSTVQLAAPKPISAPQQANLSSMVGLSSVSPMSSTTTTPAPNLSAFAAPSSASSSARATKPTGYQPSQPNYFSSVPLAPAQSTAFSSGAALAGGAGAKAGGSKAASSGGGGDAFGALWSQASAGISKKPNATGSGPAMGQLAKEKSSAGIWGAPAAGVVPTKAAGGGSAATSGLGDLLG